MLDTIPKKTKLKLLNKKTETITVISLTEINEKEHNAKCTIEFDKEVEFEGEKIISIKQLVDSAKSIKNLLSEFGLTKAAKNFSWLFE
jgi:hypothetical protein